MMICGNCNKAIEVADKTIQGERGVYHDYCPEPDMPEIGAIHHVKLAEKRWGTNVTYVNGVVLIFTGKLAAQVARFNANRIYSGLAAVGWTPEEIQRAFPEPVSTARAVVQVYKLSREKALQR